MQMWVLQYDGEFFEDVIGSGFTAGVDRVFCRITFRDEGDIEAHSAVITTTQNGAVGFSFEVPDFSNLPDGLRVSSNSFGNWVDGLPTTWSLQVSGNITGDSGDEDLAIDDFLGDTAGLDIGNPSESAGLTFDSGQFTATAVPEPSSAAILFIGASVFAFRRKRAGIFR